MELRFEFGKNWLNYSKRINPERISRSAESLQQNLGMNDLKGKTFLDIGSGSGIHSLAAAQLGASIHSFDYDTNAVACTKMVKEKFQPGYKDWKIEQGSVLEDSYVKSLGKFDVVYSWGVLHHTGNMWKAIENAASAVKEGGKLYIAIYNDQGGASNRWKFTKRLYNKLPRILQLPFILILGAFFTIEYTLAALLNFRNPLGRGWNEGGQIERGMTAWYDLVDWAGGYPFEVAKPDEILDFHTERGFIMEKLHTVGSGHGCVEYVFRRSKN